MAFTEQDLAWQTQEIDRMAKELRLLNDQFKEQKKALGYAEDQLVLIDEVEMTPEAVAALAEYQAEAKRAGQAAAAQIPSSAASSSPAPRGRRGALRI